MIRNLLFYLYPKAHTPWRWHVDKLLEHKEVWNGRRIVVVAGANATEAMDDVAEVLEPLDAEILLRDNDAALYEARHFIEPLGRLASEDPDEATFYAHSKGTTRKGRELANVTMWSKAMYDLNLARIDVVDEMLKKYGTVGAFRMQHEDHGGSDWHYSGTFFWLKHVALFSGNWTSFHDDRYAVEGYPGRHFRLEESYDLCPEKYTPGQLYSEGITDTALARWLARLGGAYQHAVVQRPRISRSQRIRLEGKMTAEVTIATPTQDRPEAFELCATWMARQTYQGSVQWIIVDDGREPVNMESPAIETAMQQVRDNGWGVQYIRREPSEPGICTLQDNLLAAIERAEGKRFLIVEDDEYYAPIYIEEMVWRLENADIVGETKARYYNVRERRWGMMESNKHASLCRTGLWSTLLPTLAEAAVEAKAQNTIFVDMLLWGAMKAQHSAAATAAAKADEKPALHPPGRPWAPYLRNQAPKATASLLPATTKTLLFEGRGISVGVKGMPGRAGIGGGHRSRAFKNPDPAWAKLIEWIGPDARPYMELATQLGWKPVR
jgi:hypothetical protein